MWCSHLAITPSLGSCNLLGLFSDWSFSNRVSPELNLSEPTYAWFAQMLSHQTLLFLTPLPRRSSYGSQSQSGEIEVKMQLHVSAEASSVKSESRQPPPKPLLYVMHGDPLLQLGRLGQSSQKSVKPGQLTAVKVLANRTGWKRGVSDKGAKHSLSWSVQGA